VVVVGLGVDDPEDLEFYLGPSPIAGAVAAGITLDASPDIAAINAQLPVNTPKFTFADSLFALRSVTDQASLLSQRFAGQIDHLHYQIDAVDKSLDRARSSRSNPADQVKKVLAWETNRAVDQMRAALDDLRRTMLVANRALGFHIVAQDRTLAGVAASIPAPIAELMTLNPRLCARPIVPAHTTVRYYA